MTPISRRSAIQILGAAAVAACSDTTGLTRVAFTLRAGGVERAAGQPLTVASKLGWAVTLTEARLAIGPVYFNVAPPLSGAGSTATCSTTARHRPRPLLPRLRALLEGTAHADETQDHLGGGRVIAQVLGRTVVDLLSPALVTVGAGDGVSETAHTAEVWLLPEDPAGKSPTLPGKAVAHLAGTAQRPDPQHPDQTQTVPFRADVLLDAAAAGRDPIQDLRKARRIPAELPLTAADPGAAEAVVRDVVLRIDPRPWFCAADFTDLLARPAEGGVFVAGPDDQLTRALRNGVRQSDAVYRFALA